VLVADAGDGPVAVPDEPRHLRLRERDRRDPQHLPGRLGQLERFVVHHRTDVLDHVFVWLTRLGTFGLVWILIALASAYYVYRLAAHHSPIVRTGWVGVFALLFAGTLVYPAAAYASQVTAQQAATLDGDELYAGYHADDAAGIAWLEQHATKSAVIVEGMGNDYSDAGRVAVRTSLPAVLGWVGHELQWRGSGDEAGQRERDVNTIYSSADAKEVQRLLQKYAVGYVFVGDVEHSKYPSIPLARMASVIEKAFEQGGTTVYRVK